MDQDQPPPSDINNHDQESYQEYVKRYCLNYVRTFFNSHYDIEWFRQRYSPLEYKRFVEKERARAHKEALAIVQELNNDVSQQDPNSANSEDVTNAIVAHSDASPATFVLNARLGGGVKPTSSSHYDSYSLIHNRNSNHNYHNHHTTSSTTTTTTRKRKYNSTSDAPLTSSLRIDSNVPKSHLISFIKENRALRMTDIPPEINNHQLLLALKDHCDESAANDAALVAVNAGGENDKEGGGDTTAGSSEVPAATTTVVGNVYPVEIYSSSVIEGVCSVIADTSMEGTNNGVIAACAGTSTSSNGTLWTGNDMPYHRSAWAVFESEAAKVCHYM